MCMLYIIEFIFFIFQFEKCLGMQEHRLYSIGKAYFSV